MCICEGKPDFAKEGTTPNKEFAFPRFFHHGAEWKMATNETESHWLTADQTFKSKYITTHSIKQRPVDRGNLQSRWKLERKIDEEKK